MKFDTKKFKKTKWRRRESAVPVPDLAEFFEDIKECQMPVWRVRNLTGHEVGAAKERADNAKNVLEIASALASKAVPQIKAALEQALALTEATPAAVSRNIYMLETASVDPQIDHEAAVRLCTSFPVVFGELVAEVLRLTGLGDVSGESNASGGTPTCETPSTSAPEADSEVDPGTFSTKPDQTSSRKDT